MPSEDLYEILGILPDAEDVVVTAAYRALAQRYHPDKWRGDPAEAHEKMSRINFAYTTLGDREKRRAYDKTRNAHKSSNFSPDEDRAAAFMQAFAEVEDKWNVACSIFPDLKDLRLRLSHFSASLAFSYVTLILETKRFNSRKEIADGLEYAFLRRYFGDDEAIILYASTLIWSGEREAARALNSIVDVMGSDIDSKIIIAKIESDFRVAERAAEQAKFETERQDALNKSESAKRDLISLKSRVKFMGHVDDARRLAEHYGFSIKEHGGGFFSAPRIEMLVPNRPSMQFKNYTDFVQWTQDNLVNL